MAGKINVYLLNLMTLDQTKHHRQFLKEILRLIVEGNTNEKIATILNISVNTVRVHIWNICTKQDVKSREEIIDESKNMQVLL